MRKGQKASTETRARMSAAQSGEKNASWGKSPTPGTRARISASLRGRIFSPEHRAKLSAAMKGVQNFLGKKHSSQTRAKMSVAQKGKIFAPEHRARLSAAGKGKKPSLEARANHLAAMRSLKVRTKLAVAQKRRFANPRNHPLWRGGISREPYGWEWNAELREEVRRRDGYRCQVCGVSQAECEKKLPVHHIDYDKKNSDPVNLVTLCVSCHTRTNTNRSHWKTVFEKQRRVETR